MIDIGEEIQRRLNSVETPKDHMNVILEVFEEAFKKKYTDGQREHGGRLWKKRTINFMMEEVIDFISYTFVLAPQLKRIEKLLEEGIQSNNNVELLTNAVRALQILRFGNEEGIPEEEH